MHTFFLAFATVFLAEMGDRTQLLALLLVAQYRQPWPILGGILVATIANHLAAGLIGAWFGNLLTPVILDTIVGVSMLGMALWTLVPDDLSGQGEVTNGRGAFLATTIAFFIAEIGDKTQIATVALAAGYANSMVAIVIGTTTGLLAANLPVVFLGNAFASRLPLKTIHYAASALFAIVGAYFLTRAVLA
jgi:putative Ca2+/H+ antiporter (TMEM165/GDT1 family)